MSKWRITIVEIIPVVPVPKINDIYCCYDNMFISISINYN